MSKVAARPKRRWLRWLALLILAGFIILGKGYWNAMRDPIVREASVAMPNWPEGSAPIKVLLIADTHVAGPDMSPERLTRILRQLNATKPDLILLAGDYISEKAVATHIYTPAELAAPFAVLKAQLGIVAVPGNHDHWADLDGIIAELRKNGVTVIANSAVKRGPLVIGGVDDDYTDHDNLAATYAAMDALEVQGAKAPRLLLTHGPDVVPDLPTPVGAVLTGHTHCGQIVLPLIGAISYVSRYGDRFACGDIKDKGPDGAIQRVFVTAGLGTSILPLRYGAHPDVWLITLGPRGRK